MLVPIPAQQVLAGQLGLAIDGCRFLDRVVLDRLGHTATEHGDRTGEHEALEPGGESRVEQVLRRAEIDFPAAQGIDFARRSQPGNEVDHGVGSLGEHDLVHIFGARRIHG
jgi:hypothetical protein